MDKREAIISFLMDQIIDDDPSIEKTLVMLLDLYGDQIIDKCRDTVWSYGSHEVPNQIKDMITRDMVELKSNGSR